MRLEKSYGMATSTGYPSRGRLPALTIDLVTIPLGFVTRFGSRLFISGLNVALDFPKLANAAAVKKNFRKNLIENHTRLLLRFLQCKDFVHRTHFLFD